ncbi:MAG: Gfo/Idh/MocA family oxidoreductase, partial [Bacteroidetes bacterium]|nr:Gfo/Idh/MocA family oxidoreductase [Bacteroidota bacterium]
MKIGMIGYGSIGRRHVENLLFLGQKDIVLLREIGVGNPHNLQEVSTIEDLILAKPQAIILANPTSMHSKYLELILKDGIDILAEKPLVSSISEVNRLERELIEYSGVGMTAFNLRFHPCIQKAKEILSSGLLGNIYSARLYVGQYLPDWRPGKNYSEIYSAKKELGGGVVFDLIHEIDIACDLFGVPTGRISSIVD